MMRYIVEKKFIRNFGLLLAIICIFITLSGCVLPQINSISTTTPQPVGDPCLQRNHSNSSIHISPTDIPGLRVDEVRAEIMSYLDSGGNASGLQPLILDIQNNVIGSLVETDLDNDGRKEIVLSTTTATQVDRYKLGWVGVYECQMGKYSASYAELGEFMESVKVRSVKDVFETGTSQIFVEYYWNGWSCTVGMQVLALSSNKWSWAFGNYLNCPTTVSIRTNQTTGRSEIVFQGILHDVMGNNPDKEVIQVYTENNGEFQLQP